MDEQVANEIIDFILSKEHKWTLVVSSKNERWKSNCSRIITLHNGKIVTEIKK
jgi:predicted ABC-type transport system involved in lysophospholipase L1 biosynthesis ATPase subunit